MNSFYSITASLLLLISIGGCVDKKAEAPVYEKYILPQWYLTPPKNANGYLYGVGEGSDRDEAVKRSLVDMASKFGITVALHYESNSKFNQRYREYYSKSIRQNLKSEVASIHIDNYEVVEVQKIRYNRFIALIRSEKARFTRSLAGNLDREVKKLKAQEKGIAKSDLITRYNFYTKAAKTLEDAFSTLLVLNALSDTFSDEPYLQVTAEINQKLMTLKKNMTFSINEDQDSSGFAKVIRTALTDHQIKISDAENKNHLSIFLITTVNNSTSYGFNIAKTVLLITIKDHHGEIIGGNRLNINGQATQGQAAALENASKKLIDMIKKEGLAKVLGVHLDL